MRAGAAGGAEGRRVVVISANSAWNIANFRTGLIRGLRKSGYQVVAVAREDRHVGRIRAEGCAFLDIPMDAKGTNPFADAALFFRYWRMLRQLRPVAFLGFTVKPNIYGSLAARALDIPTINNIAGLGTAFQSRGWLNKLVRALYALALRDARRVFFQNADDRALFLDFGVVRSSQAALLPGSGVDLTHFSPRSSGKRSGVVALMSARLLWDKGVGEFVAAMRTLRARGVECDARLLGFLDVANPLAVPRHEVEAWQREGVISYLGETDDVRAVIAEADVVVLPSYYREGTPRALLEAAAMGKPIISTDAPGCRDVVRDGINGYLIPMRDAEALATAIGRFVALSPEERSAMGDASRRLVERSYDERIVVEAYTTALGTMS